MSELTPIGKTNWRNQNQPFGIKDQDRFAHIYCIGKSGVGKSTLLLNMAISDIERGHGVCVLDPHSDLATTLLDYIPQSRIDDVIYFNPKDLAYPLITTSPPITQLLPISIRLQSEILVVLIKVFFPILAPIPL